MSLGYAKKIVSDISLAQTTAMLSYRDELGEKFVQFVADGEALSTSIASELDQKIAAAFKKEP